MKKLELATALADRVPGLSLTQATAATEAIIDIMADALTRGHSITLRGFATIKPVVHAPRKARNLSTGETVDVPARRSVKFILSNELKNQLNQLNNGTLV